MIFWTPIMLAGLAAVAIPILIHLLNRQRATIMDWGAMRFLLDSLARRKRRILIEEIILLALRCLAVALVALAMARPFIPSRTTIPWVVVLPAILAAAMCAGVGIAMSNQRLASRILLGAAGALVALALITSAVEHFLQTRHWSLSGGEKDVAIILDGSRSMTLTLDGKTNFQRAVEEAQTTLAVCKPGDGVALFVAGSVLRPIIQKPTADHKAVEAALAGLAPTGGTMKVPEALDAAVTALKEGSNPAKMIVLVTDGQALGWNVENEARWRFLADDAKKFPTPLRFFCRTLKLPGTFHNATLADLAFSRPVVGTDRPVSIEVKIANSGTVRVEPSGVNLSVDGEAVGRQPIAPIPPGAEEAVRFEHRFRTPGPHVVAAQVVCEDDLPSDNSDARVLEVLDVLKVLVVDGAPSPLPLEGASAFVDIALTPGAADEAPASAPAEGAGETEGAAPLGRLIVPTVLAAPDIRRAGNLKDYSLVILANVPMLPKDFADKLAQFVQEGGGLLIAPGDRADAAFYNAWIAPGGGPVMPAGLVIRKARTDEPARLALKTLTHPALAVIANSTQSDADKALVSAWWRLGAQEKDPAIRVGGFLDTNDAVLVERKVAKGLVLATAMALDRQDSNLPSLKCFVPLVHEMAYYLAAPSVVQRNIPAGTDVVLDLAPKPGTPAAPAGSFAVGVQTPGGTTAQAEATVEAGRLRLRYTATYEPGLYRLLLPDTAAKPFAIRLAPGGGVPFVVLGEPEESRLAALTDMNFEEVRKHLEVFRARTTDELTTAVAGSIPGEELWKYLAVALLLGLVAENGLTRWIASRRKYHSDATVRFGEQFTDMQTFRQHAQEILSPPAPKAEATAKPR
jgi:hypothetical protein